MTLELKILRSGDARVLEHAAQGVFDNPVDPELSAAFLRDSCHHIAVAIEDGVVVGFASAVDYSHPDKPRELWINEMGVAAARRGRGIGKQVLEAMLAHGRALGCREAWVLTDRDNAAAMRLYGGAGGKARDQDQVMFTFHLNRDDG